MICQSQNPCIFNPPLWWNQNSQALWSKMWLARGSNGSGRTWKWQAWKYRGEIGGKRVREERVACFSGREKAPFKSDSDSEPPCEAQSPTSYTQTSVHPVFSIFFFFGLLFLVVFVVWVFGLLQDSGLGETTVPEAQKRVEGALRFAPKEILSGSGWFKAKAARIYTEREREKKRYSLFHAIFSLWRQLISLLLSLYQRFIFCLSDAFSFLCVFCKPFLRRVFRARSFRFLSVQASSTSS